MNVRSYHWLYSSPLIITLNLNWNNTTWVKSNYFLKTSNTSTFFPYLTFPIGRNGFPGGSDDKESACSAGDLGSIPGSGRSPGEEKYPLGTSHSSILAWRIPWTEEPGRLQIMGLQRVVHDWATKYTCTLAGKSSLRSLCSKSTYPYLFLKKWLIVILSGMGSINLNNIFLKWESQSP